MVAVVQYIVGRGMVKRSMVSILHSGDNVAAAVSAGMAVVHAAARARTKSWVKIQDHDYTSTI